MYIVQDKIFVLERMRRIFFVIIALIACVAAWAAPVDQQSALKKAKAFLAERGNDMLLSERGVRKAPAKSAGEGEYYYVFNAEDGNGFVIVAGTDLTEPILGFSEEGHFEPDQIPEGLKALLKMYEETVDVLSEQEEAGEQMQRREVRRVMDLPRHYVAPFLTKHWSYKAPYNGMNPVVNDTICPTGCATVALAQVMGHYEWPEIMPRALSYTTATNQLKMPTLPRYEIDWENMLSNYYLETYDSLQAAAVARLMLHLGCGLRSDYCTKVTGGSSSNVPGILRACDYRCSDYALYLSKTQDEWENILFDDVSHGRLILVAGFELQDNSGHLFVIDGYDMDGLWHIDWGWGGGTNGFYRLTNISPYRNTTSYTYMRNIRFIYNIEPILDESATTTSRQKPYDCLTTTSLTFEETGDIYITRTNLTGAKRVFNQGLGLVDDDGQLVRVLDSERATYTSKGSSTSLWNITDLSGYRNGHLRAYPVSQVADGDGNWHFDECKAENACLDVDITNGEYTLSAVPALTYDSLTVDSKLSFPVGAARQYELSITNNKMNDHRQWLYLFEDSILIDNQIVDVPPMSTAKHIFTYIPSEVGEHTLYLCSDTANTKVLIEKQVKVTKSIAYSLSLVSWEMDNYVKGSKTSYFYGDKLRFRFKLKNSGKNDYNDFVRALLASTSWYDTQKYWVHIPAGGTKEFEFTSDILNYATTYSIRLSVKSSSHSNSDILNTQLTSVSFKPRRGICWWDKNGIMHAQAPSSKAFTVSQEALAVSFYGNTTLPSSIVPNSNPNTIYYLTKDYPKTLTTHNKVINGKAGLIHLTDTMSAFVPIDFQADSIVYTRTFDKGFTGRRNGNNWSTLTLPFTPDRIFNTVDSVDVDWYKPGDTEEKNFWLRELYAEEGFYAYFTDAEQIVPNTPYIVTVPDNYKGEDYCLVGKPLEFSAGNADVISGKSFADTDNYNFIGSLSESNSLGDYIYWLNEENGGNHFIYLPDMTVVKPFRAYFAARKQPRDGSKMFVASYVFQPESSEEGSEETDGVIELAAPESPSWSAETGIYTITGVKVASVASHAVGETLSTLPRGIYVVNGRKVLVR